MKKQAFHIEVTQNVLDDLQERLAQTRWADEPADAGWAYGMNPDYLRRLVEYWRHDYDWGTQEALLNRFPQFRVEMDGVGVHFVHVARGMAGGVADGIGAADGIGGGRGTGRRALILTHEWPDSFMRFYKVIPMLSAEWDLVIPSMPGHGFSDPVTLTSAETGRLWGKLMTEVLGYTEFYAGGDYAVTTALAQAYPDAVRGLFLTDTGYPNGTEQWASYSPAEQAFGQAIQRWFFAEGAFNMIQSTKPQTLAYGLSDSPVGLAAWIAEKFFSWSDTRGDMENSFSYDEVLTNIMIYWVTGTISTSTRRYAADARALWAKGFPEAVEPVKAPTAVAIFPADSDTPREWAARRVNLQYYTKMAAGGRFAALEVPEAYVAFLRDAVVELEKVNGI